MCAGSSTTSQRGTFFASIAQGKDVGAVRKYPAKRAPYRSSVLFSPSTKLGGPNSPGAAILSGCNAAFRRHV